MVFCPLLKYARKSIQIGNEVCGGAFKEYKKETCKLYGEGKVIKEKCLRCQKKKMPNISVHQKTKKFMSVSLALVQ